MRSEGAVNVVTEKTETCLRRHAAAHRLRDELEAREQQTDALLRDVRRVLRETEELMLDLERRRNIAIAEALAILAQKNETNCAE